MTPAITVVVPTYNRASMLELTLRSILSQTTPIVEILVVDDGSTDETSAVCARQPNLVRYLRQENTGRPAFGRNRGFAEAKGDWIALCDSDDLWHPKKLELQLAAIAETGAEWSVSGFGLIDHTGVEIPIRDMGFEREFPVFRGGVLSSSEHFGSWLSRKRVHGVDVFFGDAFGMLFQGNVCLTSSSVIKKDLVARAGGFDTAFTLAEDTEFFHRLAAHAPVAIVMSHLLDYRVGHPSMMSVRDLSPAIRFALDSLERAAKLRPVLTPVERRAYRSGREQLRLRLAYERLSSLDPRGARAAVREGWKAGDLRSLGAVAMWMAGFVPIFALRLAHKSKRAALRRGSSKTVRARDSARPTDTSDGDVKSAHGVGE
jgi:glycosyltransferase involved in cell wall biosynthesis